MAAHGDRPGAGGGPAVEAQVLVDAERDLGFSLRCLRCLRRRRACGGRRRPPHPTGTRSGVTCAQPSGRWVAIRAISSRARYASRSSSSSAFSFVAVDLELTAPPLHSMIEMGALTDLRVTLLAGGVGGARFALGLADAVGPESVTIVGNVGDDVELLGLHVSPGPRHVPLHARRHRPPRAGLGRRRRHARGARRRRAARRADWFSSATATSACTWCARSGCARASRSRP